jgi:hypothetical protein
MLRVVSGVCLAVVLAGCVSGNRTIGERPPEGTGPGGTYFGYWNRDADGAVDQGFRKFIKDKYDFADSAKARTDLEADGFECRDGNRPDGRPVPVLECARLYRRADTVYDWSVEFWPSEPEPRARYQRTQYPDPLKAPNVEKPKPPG